MGWQPHQDDELRRLAAAGLSTRDAAERMGLKRDQVRYRARRLKIRFDPAASRPLMKFLRKKGVLQREEVGGAIGVRWTAAVRTGQSFPAELCELFRADGHLQPVDGRADIFQVRDGGLA